MKHFFIVALIALGLLCPGPVQAATLLTDPELVGVSGGGADPGGQSLPQDQQQPGSNSSGYTPPQQLPVNDGMDLAPEVFAVLQSTIDVQRERNVLLNGATQQNALALNLENLLSSDSIATNNIFNGSSLSTGNVTAEIEINQVNSLEQLHRTQGSLSSSIAGLRHETTVESHSGSQSYLYYDYSLVDRQLTSDQVRTRTDSSHVSVGMDINSLAQLSSTLPPPIIPVKSYGPYLAFTAEAMVDGLIGDKYGASFEYSGVTLDSLGFTVESFETQNNDLVLGTQLTLPSVNLGTLKATGCIGLCLEGIVDFGSMGGQDFSRNVIIPNMGPRFDELNLSSGFAVIGSGNLRSDGPSLHISGEAAVKVTPYAKATLDLSKVKVGKIDVGSIVKSILGENKWATSKSFDLINLQVPFALIDWKGEPYDSRFNGSIFYGDNANGDTNHSATDNLDQNDNSLQTSIKVDVAESSFSESYEHRVFTGGQMTGAEAELLALSDGTLSVSNNNNVRLNEGAQQNMRVLNGVNASSSVAANALNMSRLPAFRAGPATGSRTIMTQQNRFNQQM